VRRSDELNELLAALSKAQGEFTPVPKTAANPFFNSMYADLAGVVEHIRPVLAKHGLVVSQHIEDQGEHPVITTILGHSSGQFLISTMRLLMSKADMQGVGSAVTYARRYAYCAVLGIVADRDDDGNAAVESMPVRRSTGTQPNSAAAKKQSDKAKAQRYRDGANRDQEHQDAVAQRQQTVPSVTTEAQLKFLSRLTGTTIEQARASYGAMSPSEASALIDQLKEGESK
jgi:hypothetical protein